jgi:Phage P2 GpE
MMADLAQTFHWSPDKLKVLALEELVMWHAEAVLRNPAEKA